MKKRSLLLIALIAVLCLSIVGVVACKPNEPVDPDKQSIEISNAMALAAKWNVGEADRTVEVELSDGLKDKAVTLTAEPEGIVTIDGMKLTAAKNGTTVVTARVSLDEEHEYTDSVEIKVTYNYSLTISNKSALTKAFRLGEDDREVKITLSDAIKNNKVDIKSSNINAVTVVNGKLHAQAKGESTITATTSLNGVEFKDSFKVTVWGAFDLTVDNLADFANPIGKNVTKAIEYTLHEQGDYTAADVNITSDHPEIVAIEGSSIKTLATGTAKITVACGGITREFNVTVEVQPVLTLGEFDENGEYYTRQGNAFELPTIEAATNSLEQDVKANVQLVYDTTKLTITENEGHRYVWTDEIGRYTVTYKFADIAGKPDKEVAVEFDVVDKFFSETGAHLGDNNESSPLKDAKISTNLIENEGNYSQTVTSDTDSLLFAKLDGGEASKYYYAEATFAIETTRYGTDSDITVAMGHFRKDNGRRVLISELNTFTGDFLNIQAEFNKTGNIYKSKAEENGQTCTYFYKIFRTRFIERQDEQTQKEFDNFDKNAGATRNSTQLVTIAIARDGDYFYTFLNGQYVNCLTYEEFRAVDTQPAIIGMRFKSGGVAVSNISYVYEESAVTEKLYSANGVLGVNKEKMLVPYAAGSDGSKTTYDKSFAKDTDGNYKYTTATDINRGLGFDYNTPANFNDSIVSPYIFFEKDFTISWEYKHTDPNVAFKSSSNTYRFTTELRDYTYGNEVVKFGGIFRRNDVLKNEFYMSTEGYANNADYKAYGEPLKDDEEGFDDSLGAKYTLTRVLKEDHAEIVMTATSIANPSQTYTRIVTWGNIADNNLKQSSGKVDSGYKSANQKWDQPAIILWHNTAKGEYSNIKWSVIDQDIEASLVATAVDPINATRLTETTTPDDGSEPVTTNLDQWQFTLNSCVDGDIVLDLGENALEAGEYELIISAKCLQAVTTGTKDLMHCDIYNKITITVAEGDRYLKLSGLTLGHGTYNITLTKVVEPTPDPAPQEPTE